MAKEETFIQVSLEDSKTKSISEVLNSKTCKKIINHLAEVDEASQKDISDALKIPMNTLGFNMKKLLSSGFIQKRKNFFWSKKGKKIPMYELSNKTIVISPKRSIGEKAKTLIPGFMLTLAGTFAVFAFERIKGVNPSYDSVGGIVSEKVVEGAAPIALKTADFVAEGSTQVVNSVTSTPLWAAFLAGALVLLGAYTIINWKKL